MSEDRKHAIIGLDLGTHCGWAIFQYGERMASGTWNLSIRRHEGQGMRLLRFRQSLDELVERTGARILGYEIPITGAMKGSASIVFGALLGALHTRCDTVEPTLTYKGVGVSTVKKLATGKGNANKEAMVQAAKKRWPGVETHDEADACFVALALHEEITA